MFSSSTASVDMAPTGKPALPMAARVSASTFTQETQGGGLAEPMVQPGRRMRLPQPPLADCWTCQPIRSPDRLIGTCNSTADSRQCTNRLILRLEGLSPSVHSTVSPGPDPQRGTIHGPTVNKQARLFSPRPSRPRKQLLARVGRFLGHRLCGRRLELGHPPPGQDSFDACRSLGRFGQLLRKLDDGPPPASPRPHAAATKKPGSPCAAAPPVGPWTPPASPDPRPVGRRPPRASPGPRQVGRWTPSSLVWPSASRTTAPSSFA